MGSEKHTSFKTTDGGTTWTLQARAVNAPGDEITVIIRPDPLHSEPCRIYDILGTQVGTVRFEAQASITIF